MRALTLALASGQLVAASWPDDLPRFAKDAEHAAEYEGWEIVPTELRSWCYVDRDPDIRDKTRDRLLVYMEVEPNDATYEVSIRVQGFIQRCALGPYGNWNGLV